MTPDGGRRPGSTPSWAVEHHRGPAADLHALGLPARPGRAVWVLDAASPALVLGSTQGRELVDLDAAVRHGVAVAGRRSGGGAVLVDPRTTVWVDLIVPAGDPLWDDDVVRAAAWVGRAWQAALADLGVTPTVVHEGPLACGPLGRLVCFGTVGAGEVTTPEGAKVVGVSQRRTRSAARFQCATYSAWQPDLLVELLRLEGDGARSLADAAVGTGVPADATVEALIGNLPD